MTTQPASRSPTLEELLRTAIEYYLEEVHTSMPGRITEFDPVEQRAEVQPMVNRLIETEEGDELEEPFPPITDVPIIFPRTKNFVVTFPIEVGDLVLLLFTERSIDKWLSSDAKTPVPTNPDDFFRHDLSQAVAIPGLYPFGRPVTNFDNEALTIGADGSTIVRVKKDLIELGAKGSTDQVPRESKVQTELSALQTNLSSLVTAFNAHVHPTAALGLPSIPTPVPSSIPATPPAAIAATASTLVTLEK